MRAEGFCVFDAASQRAVFFICIYGDASSHLLVIEVKAGIGGGVVMKKIIVLIPIILLFVLVVAACTPATTATHNVKYDADNFKLYRRITAINLRTDNVLFEIEGFFSYENEMDGDLSIIMEVGDNEYKRHAVRMTEGTSYVVEQLEASEFSPYSWKIRIYATYPDIDIGR